MKAENFGVSFIDIDLPFPCEIHFSYFYSATRPDRFKVLMLHTEPEEIRLSEAELARWHSHFNLIITHDKRHLVYPTARFLQHVDPYVYDLPKEKRFEISSILSVGCRLPTVAGYPLRIEVTNRRGELRIPHRFYVSNRFPGKENTGLPTLLNDKKDCMFESMFHIAIENGSEPDYCTEKLLDCFTTYTVPIYMGCPNLDEYFNADAVIRASGVDDIIRIANGLTLDDYYSRLPALYENRTSLMRHKPFLEVIRDLIIASRQGWG